MINKPLNLKLSVFNAYTVEEAGGSCGQRLLAATGNLLIDTSGEGGYKAKEGGFQASLDQGSPEVADSTWGQNAERLQVC